jgi:hypothetical protein
MNATTQGTTRSTPQHDAYGLPLSTSPVAAAAYVRAVDRLLSLQADPESELEDAVAADPGFALANAILALRRLRQGRPGAADAHLRRARAVRAALTPRERGHVDAVAALVEGAPTAALAIIRTHLAAFPREALLLQEATAIISAGGAPDLRHTRRALMAGVAPSYHQDGWFMGDWAFELAEAGRCAAARRLAERARAARPWDANAVHSLVHALSEGGDQAAAVDLLRDWLPGYAPTAPEYSHLAWHLAMSELRLGHRRAALAVYRARLDPSAAPRTRLRDAAGFLWSLTLTPAPPTDAPAGRGDGRQRGREAPSWAPVRDLAAQACRQPMEAADVVHAAMAFGATGDDAAAGRLLASLRQQIAAGDTLAGTLVVPLVRGILAFGAGQYAAASARLVPVMPHLVRLGLSNGQTAVIAATLTAARQRSGAPCRRPRRRHTAETHRTLYSELS